MTSVTLTLQDVRSEVVVIGLDAEPQLSAQSIGGY